MFSKKDLNHTTAHSAKDFDLIIGPGTEISGMITSSGSVRIDGRLLGDLTCAGDAFVGDQAKVDGDITAAHVAIAGDVTGKVVAEGALSIYGSGILIGDIEVASFSIAEGGVFEGMCHINTQRAKGLRNTRQGVSPSLPQDLSVLEEFNSLAAEDGAIEVPDEFLMMSSDDETTEDQSHKNNKRKVM